MKKALISIVLLQLTLHLQSQAIKVNTIGIPFRSYYVGYEQNLGTHLNVLAQVRFYKWEDSFLFPFGDRLRWNLYTVESRWYFNRAFQKYYTSFLAGYETLKWSEIDFFGISPIEDIQDNGPYAGLKFGYVLLSHPLIVDFYGGIGFSSVTDNVMYPLLGIHIGYLFYQLTEKAKDH